MKTIELVNNTNSPNAIPTDIADAPTWAQDVFQSLPCLASYDDIGRASRMNRGTIANFHSEGRGPKGSVLLGKKRVFPRLEVCKWLMEMAEAKEAE